MQFIPDIFKSRANLIKSHGNIVIFCLDIETTYKFLFFLENPSFGGCGTK